MPIKRQIRKQKIKFRVMLYVRILIVYSKY
jgi:hypothetical protein